MTTPPSSDEKLGRSTRRWANAFAFPSLLLVILCAAFAEQTSRALGIHPFVIYGVAIVAGVLTFAMILGAESTTSSAVYRALGIAYALSAIALSGIFIAYVVVDAAGTFGGNEYASMGIVLGLLVIALGLLSVAIAQRMRIR